MAILKRIYHLLINFFSLFAGFFVGRTKKCVLIGAWGGQKFADNSRYLFQYLYKNKERLALKRVVWVTRSKNINDYLNAHGYESYLIGTKRSFYWHLKCGVHVICNMTFGFGNFKSDIDNRFSCGAKKIQLWHGVGIKAIGKASNGNKNSKFRSFFNAGVLGSIFSLGCWYNEYFLCTSEINKEINFATNNCIFKHLFISSYPRFLPNNDLTENEKQTISEFQRFNGVILYLPTFRKTLDNYQHPLDSDVFLDFLRKTNCAFIEKLHSAAVFTEREEIPNVIYLDKNFDINVLFPYVTCVISDYSSAAFDAIHIKKPVIIYVPDLEAFKNSDVGLIMDIEQLFQILIAKDCSKIIELTQAAINGTFFNSGISEIYTSIDDKFFCGTQKDYEEIWADITAAISGSR